MTRALAAAIWIARAWTRLYTSGLDPALRDARRAEIESDLWESHEDARRRGPAAVEVALQILARVLLGASHDLLWTIEHRQRRSLPLRRLALIAGAATLLAVLWVLSVTQNSPLPVPPHSMLFVASPPPPPPPPPLPPSMEGTEAQRARPGSEPPRR